MVAAEQQHVLANMIGRIQERTILDVGTGYGRSAIMLALGAADVTAIDSSEALLVEARRRATAHLVKVNFLHGDAHELRFGPRSFDVVVALGVLQSATDWRQCLAEACRVADRLVIFDYPSAASVALVRAADVAASRHRVAPIYCPHREPVRSPRAVEDVRHAGHGVRRAGELTRTSRADSYVTSGFSRTSKGGYSI